MLDIKFVPDMTGSLGLNLDEEVAGQICIGSHSEHFSALLIYWQKIDYLKSWEKSISDLISGFERTALITSLADPTVSDALFWWPLYRVGDTVYVQQHLLFMKDISKTFDAGDFTQWVPARCTLSEDGDPISEWRADMGSLHDLLRRLRSRIDEELNRQLS